MASVLHRTLFTILFLFIIINSIDAYRLPEHINSDEFNDDSTSYDRINRRSVLWPKICFLTLSKKTEHQNPNNQYQWHEYNTNLSKRNPRKCYPFDTN